MYGGGRRLGREHCFVVGDQESDVLSSSFFLKLHLFDDSFTPKSHFMIDI